MSYLGRHSALAGLTSADIPDDSITAAKIVDGAVTSDLVYLENVTATQNLSGTYSTERMYLNDSYTLTGDVTVTGHLALGTVADSDVIITQDSTERTITGSGTLESGALMNERQTSLTGMTGVVGDAVTGSPNLNLTTGLANSNTSFPAGHVVQTVSYFLDNPASIVSATRITDMSIAMSGVTSGNKIYISATWLWSMNAGGSTAWFNLYLSSTNADTMGLGEGTSGYYFAPEIGRTGHTAGQIFYFGPSYLTSAVTTATPSYHIYAFNYGTITGWPDNFQIQCMEIQQ